MSVKKPWWLPEYRVKKLCVYIISVTEYIGQLRILVLAEGPWGMEDYFLYDQESAKNCTYEQARVRSQGVNLWGVYLQVSPIPISVTLHVTRDEKITKNGWVARSATCPKHVVKGQRQIFLITNGACVGQMLWYLMVLGSASLEEVHVSLEVSNSYCLPKRDSHSIERRQQEFVSLELLCICDTRIIF